MVHCLYARFSVSVIGKPLSFAQSRHQLTQARLQQSFEMIESRSQVPVVLQVTSMKPRSHMCSIVSPRFTLWRTGTSSEGTHSRKITPQRRQRTTVVIMDATPLHVSHTHSRKITWITVDSSFEKYWRLLPGSFRPTVFTISKDDCQKCLEKITTTNATILVPKWI